MTDLEDFGAFDETGARLALDAREENGHIFLTLPKERFLHAKKVCVLGEFTRTAAGDAGYYVLPRTPRQEGEPLVLFRERPDAVEEQINPVLAFCGFKTKDETYLIRIERNYFFSVLARVRGGVYTMEAVFNFSGGDIRAEAPYDDIRIEIVPLGKDADYNTMAKTEREIRMEREGIEPLKKRCAERPAVDYARLHPLVRIRLGWKPSPSPVLHQTPENEPPMHVACTFERVRGIAREFARQGTGGVELQLVGWNKHGHDGAWPDKFPAEKLLGGDEGLAETINFVKSLGFRISTHDNYTDCYEIGERFDWDDVAVLPDGGYYQCGHFSSGLTYRVCACRYRRHMDADVPRIASLGENGIHYSDVMSIVVPYPCRSEKHPVSTKEAIRITDGCMEYERGVFGGFSSEGGMDFAIKYIDYALYTSFGTAFGQTDAMLADGFLPVWELTYHGVVLYNPLSATVNYTIKDPRSRLLLVMRGGKPTFYIYSKFCTGAVNWMGETDLICDTDEDMQKTVSDVCRADREFAPLAEKQLLYMTRYDILKDGLERAEYEDGSCIVGNFSDVPAEYGGRTIEPYGYILL